MPVTLNASAPGIFQFGQRRAVVQNQDGTLNAYDNPARPGSVIVAYLTGQGALDNLLVAGQAAAAKPLSAAALPVSAAFGDKPGEVLFAGMTPGFVGLLQVNLRVPNGIAGDQPLVITIGDSVSNAAMITVDSVASDAAAGSQRRNIVLNLL